MTVAPLVADGVVITGISGAEFGIRGFIDGWDPADRQASVAHLHDPRPRRAGRRHLEGRHLEARRRIDLDHRLLRSRAEHGLLGHRQSRPVQRGGASRATISTPARCWRWIRRPARSSGTTSSRRTIRSTMTAVAEMVLADINVEGKPTKVLMDANRNGFFYVLDRTNGKLLAANPYVKVNWATGIDMKTGRPIETDVVEGCARGQEGRPSIRRSSAARTGSRCRSIRRPASPTPTRSPSAATTRPSRPPTSRVNGISAWTSPISGNGATAPRGHLKAIDPMTGKAKWEAPSDIPRFSGVLSTAGGVVFSGQLTGEFEAFDADDGKKLWQFQTGSGIEGQPVTWQQDGVQYVAVTSGYGGVYSLFSGDERLAKVPTGGSLWVFAVKQ